LSATDAKKYPIDEAINTINTKFMKRLAMNPSIMKPANPNN